MKNIGNSNFRNAQFPCVNPKLGKIPALKLLSKLLLLSKIDVMVMIKKCCWGMVYQ